MKQTGAIVAVMLVLAAFACTKHSGNTTRPTTHPLHVDEGERDKEDVALIVAWIVGEAGPGPFREPFGDRHFFAEPDEGEALLYTDVPGVEVPAALRRVPYDFIQARMAAIRDGHDHAPAVLITRSIEATPMEGLFGGTARDVAALRQGERFFYVEVAIGNMAWHWMKIVLWDDDGEVKADIIMRAIS